MFCFCAKSREKTGDFFSNSNLRKYYTSMILLQLTKMSPIAFLKLLPLNNSDSINPFRFEKSNLFSSVFLGKIPNRVAHEPIEGYFFCQK